MSSATRPRSREKELDLPGMALYGSALLLTVTGFSSLTLVSGQIALAAGVVFLAIFAFRESRTLHPLLDLRLFRDNSTYTVSNLTVLIFNSSNFALIFILTLYLQSLRLIDIRMAGVILLVPVIFMFLFSTYAGRLSDRIPPQAVVGSGLVSATLGLFLFTFLDEQTSLVLVLAALSLYGLGIAFCQAPLVRTSVSTVPRKMAGLASGMIETMRLVGMTISVAISIIVFTFYVGN
ncbi:MAG: MFS transporter [Methanomicrobiales archaeon]|nr:MFS transporter [Methanomicrobiales archaeon]